MKKKINNTFFESDSVYSLLSGTLGYKAPKATRILKSYRIETIEQFIGAFRPYIPVRSQSELKAKEIVCSLDTIRRHKDPKNIVLRIQKTLQITHKEARALFASFDAVKQTTQTYRFNFGWCFGGKKRAVNLKSDYFWRNRPKVHNKGGVYVIPSYADMGKVYDQGNRGTCVANATCSLLDYKGKIKSSRQFLFHQCKMIDGIKDQEGTYIETPFKLLTTYTYIDRGCVMEKTWPYYPGKGKTTHQGPPPEEAFDCKRLNSSAAAVYPRKNNIIIDIKYLLNLKKNGKASPVVIGVPLYESFFSKSTTRNGWVTMPLPGEAIMGYHAMIITGYDDDRKLFLVRNSWSTAWAPENDHGYAGHAWIPYEYTRQYSHGAATISEVTFQHMIVSPENRLYNKSKSIRTIKRKAAATRIKRGSRTRAGKKRISVTSWFLSLVLILLLFNSYREPLMSFLKNAYDTVSKKTEINNIRNKITEIIHLK